MPGNIQDVMLHTIDRIEQGLRLNTGSHLYVLYGPGITDIFFDYNLVEHNINAALWLVLKNKGFQRIVYYSMDRSIYFYDQSSFTLTRGQQTISHIKRSGLPDIEADSIRTNAITNIESNQHLQGLETNMLGDTQALSYLHQRCMSDSSTKTALVFMNVENMLLRFENKRLLSGQLSAWSRLPSSNPNICILCLDTDNPAGLEDITREFPTIHNILQKREPSAPVLRIGSPSQQEIKYLLLHTVRNLSLFKYSDYFNLIKWMTAEGRSARQWKALLSLIDRFDIETARKNGWFESASPDSQSPEERLREMIGLKNVKEHLQRLTSLLRNRQIRIKAGILKDPEPLTQHMVFEGNPGTGKTTVARLLGEIYQEIGLLKRGHLIETKYSDLVAEHVGGTAIKTNAVIDRALDGVLFIDEAYQLAATERGEFGLEAIDTLLTRLEDDRGRLVVIVAGYPQKMGAFLKSNPGLPRRFPERNRIVFEDYTEPELLEILKFWLDKKNISRSKEFNVELEKLINDLCKQKGKDEFFGNAGTMREMADSIEECYASRVERDNKDIHEPFRPEDICFTF